MLLPGAVRKRHENTGQRKGDVLGSAPWQSSWGLHGAMVPSNSHTPKIPIFPQIRAERAAAAVWGKHVHPFIDGAQDRLPSHAGTVRAPKTEGDTGRPRKKPFFRGSGERLLPPAKTPGAEQASVSCRETWHISARRGYIAAVPAEE